MKITHSRFAQAILGSLSSILGNERGPGVLAVSGGADSAAMSRAFRELPQAGEISLAHFNHQLRGKESDNDAAFVNQLAGKQSCHHGTADVRAFAEASGENLEAVARRLRYAFLAKVARETNARWVATAHTADDQAETVLHRMIRGSGIRGLRGIAPARPLAEGIQLVRPMLGLTRTDVLDYLRAVGQDWREDATNQDTTFTRNRIRHELLPLMKTFNPQLNHSLGRLAAQAQEVYAELDRRTGGLLAAVELPKAGNQVILSRAALANIPDHNLRELFHHLWEREDWPLGHMTRDHWQRAADVAKGELTATDLPDGITVRAADHVLRIGPR